MATAANAALNPQSLASFNVTIGLNVAPVMATFRQMEQSLTTATTVLTDRLTETLTRGFERGIDRGIQALTNRLTRATSTLSDRLTDGLERGLTASFPTVNPAQIRTLASNLGTSLASELGNSLGQAAAPGGVIGSALVGSLGLVGGIAGTVLATALSTALTSAMTTRFSIVKETLGSTIDMLIKGASSKGLENRSLNMANFIFEKTEPGVSTTQRRAYQDSTLQAVGDLASLTSKNRNDVANLVATLARTGKSQMEIVGGTSKSERDSSLLTQTVLLSEAANFPDMEKIAFVLNQLSLAFPKETSKTLAHGMLSFQQSTLWDMGQLQYAFQDAAPAASIAGVDYTKDFVPMMTLLMQNTTPQSAGTVARYLLGFLNQPNDTQLGLMRDVQTTDQWGSITGTKPGEAAPGFIEFVTEGGNLLPVLKALPDIILELNKKGQFDISPEQMKSLAATDPDAAAILNSRPRTEQAFNKLTPDEQKLMAMSYLSSTFFGGSEVAKVGYNSIVTAPAEKLASIQNRASAFNSPDDKGNATLQAMIALKNQGLSGAIDQAGSSIDNVVEAMAGKLEPGLAGFVGFVVGVANKLTESQFLFTGPFERLNSLLEQTFSNSDLMERVSQGVANVIYQIGATLEDLLTRLTNWINTPGMVEAFFSNLGSLIQDTTRMMADLAAGFNEMTRIIGGIPLFGNIVNRETPADVAEFAMSQKGTKSPYILSEDKNQVEVYLPPARLQSGGTSVAVDREIFVPPADKTYSDRWRSAAIAYEKLIQSDRSIAPASYRQKLNLNTGEVKAGTIGGWGDNIQETVALINPQLTKGSLKASDQAVSLKTITGSKLFILNDKNELLSPEQYFPDAANRQTFLDSLTQKGGSGIRPFQENAPIEAAKSLFSSPDLEKAEQAFSLKVKNQAQAVSKKPDFDQLKGSLIKEDLATSEPVVLPRTLVEMLTDSVNLAPWVEGESNFRDAYAVLSAMSGGTSKIRPGGDVEVKALPPEAGRQISERLARQFQVNLQRDDFSRTQELYDLLTGTENPFGPQTFTNLQRDTLDRQKTLLMAPSASLGSKERNEFGNSFVANLYGKALKGELKYNSDQDGVLTQNPVVASSDDLLAALQAKVAQELTNADGTALTGADLKERMKALSEMVDENGNLSGSLADMAQSASKEVLSQLEDENKFRELIRKIKSKTLKLDSASLDSLKQALEIRKKGFTDQVKDLRLQEAQAQEAGDKDKVAQLNQELQKALAQERTEDSKIRLLEGAIKGNEEAFKAKDPRKIRDSAGESVDMAKTLYDDWAKKKPDAVRSLAQSQRETDMLPARLKAIEGSATGQGNQSLDEYLNSQLEASTAGDQARAKLDALANQKADLAVKLQDMKMKGLSPDQLKPLQEEMALLSKQTKVYQDQLGLVEKLAQAKTEAFIRKSQLQFEDMATKDIGDYLTQANAAMEVTAKLDQMTIQLRNQQEAYRQAIQTTEEMLAKAPADKKAGLQATIDRLQSVKAQLPALNARAKSELVAQTLRNSGDMATRSVGDLRAQANPSMEALSRLDGLRMSYRNQSLELAKAAEAMKALLPKLGEDKRPQAEAVLAQLQEAQKQLPGLYAQARAEMIRKSTQGQRDASTRSVLDLQGQINPEFGPVAQLENARLQFRDLQLKYKQDIAALREQLTSLPAGSAEAKMTESALSQLEADQARVGPLQAQAEAELVRKTSRDLRLNAERQVTDLKTQANPSQALVGNYTQLESGAKLQLESLRNQQKTLMELSQRVQGTPQASLVKEALDSVAKAILALPDLTAKAQAAYLNKALMGLTDASSKAVLDLKTQINPSMSLVSQVDSQDKAGRDSDLKFQQDLEALQDLLAQVPAESAKADQIRATISQLQSDYKALKPLREGAQKALVGRATREMEDSSSKAIGDFRSQANPSMGFLSQLDSQDKTFRDVGRKLGQDVAALQALLKSLPSNSTQASQVRATIQQLQQDLKALPELKEEARRTLIRTTATSMSDSSAKVVGDYRTQINPTMEVANRFDLMGRAFRDQMLKVSQDIASVQAALAQTTNGSDRAVLQSTLTQLQADKSSLPGLMREAQTQLLKSTTRDWGLGARKSVLDLQSQANPSMEAVSRFEGLDTQAVTQRELLQNQVKTLTKMLADPAVQQSGEAGKIQATIQQLQTTLAQLPGLVAQAQKTLVENTTRTLTDAAARQTQDLRNQVNPNLEPGGRVANLDRSLGAQQLQLQQNIASLEALALKASPDQQGLIQGAIQSLKADLAALPGLVTMAKAKIASQTAKDFTQSATQIGQDYDMMVNPSMEVVGRIEGMQRSYRDQTEQIQQRIQGLQDLAGKMRGTPQESQLRSAIESLKDALDRLPARFEAALLASLRDASRTGALNSLAGVGATATTQVGQQLEAFRKQTEEDADSQLRLGQQLTAFQEAFGKLSPQQQASSEGLAIQSNIAAIQRAITLSPDALATRRARMEEDLQSQAQRAQLENSRQMVGFQEQAAARFGELASSAGLEGLGLQGRLGGLQARSQGLDSQRSLTEFDLAQKQRNLQRVIEDAQLQAQLSTDPKVQAAALEAVNNAYRELAQLQQIAGLEAESYAQQKAQLQTQAQLDMIKTTETFRKSAADMAKSVISSLPGGDDVVRAIFEPMEFEQQVATLETNVQSLIAAIGDSGGALSETLQDQLTFLQGIVPLIRQLRDIQKEVLLAQAQVGLAQTKSSALKEVMELGSGPVRRFEEMAQALGSDSMGQYAKTIGQQMTFRRTQAEGPTKLEELRAQYSQADAEYRAMSLTYGLTNADPVAALKVQSAYLQREKLAALISLTEKDTSSELAHQHRLLQLQVAALQSVREMTRFKTDSTIAEAGWGAKEGQLGRMGQQADIYDISEYSFSKRKAANLRFQAEKAQAQLQFDRDERQRQEKALDIQGRLSKAQTAYDSNPTGDTLEELRSIQAEMALNDQQRLTAQAQLTGQTTLLVEKYRTLISLADELRDKTAGALRQSFRDFFGDLTSGTKSLEESLLSLVDNLTKRLSDVALDAIFEKWIDPTFERNQRKRPSIDMTDGPTIDVPARVAQEQAVAKAKTPVRENTFQAPDFQAWLKAKTSASESAVQAIPQTGLAIPAPLSPEAIKALVLGSGKGSPQPAPAAPTASGTTGFDKALVSLTRPTGNQPQLPAPTQPGFALPALAAPQTGKGSDLATLPPMAPAQAPTLAQAPIDSGLNLTEVGMKPIQGTLPDWLRAPTAQPGMELPQSPELPVLGELAIQAQTVILKTANLLSQAGLGSGGNGQNPAQSKAQLPDWLTRPRPEAPQPASSMGQLPDWLKPASKSTLPDWLSPDRAPTGEPSSGPAGKKFLGPLPSMPNFQSLPKVEEPAGESSGGGMGLGSGLGMGLMAMLPLVGTLFGKKKFSLMSLLPALLGVAPMLFGGKFAEGGLIDMGQRQDGDDVLALLSRGEYVMPRRAVEAWGVPFFEALAGYSSGGQVQAMKRPVDIQTGMGLPGYAKGGLVGYQVRPMAIPGPTSTAPSKSADLIRDYQAANGGMASPESPALTVKYEAVVVGGLGKVVTEDMLQSAVAQAAQMGAAMGKAQVYQELSSSPSVRTRTGLGRSRV